MAEEIAALERTCTVGSYALSPRVRLITCKWVYKVKTRFDGSLERYKARLVAHVVFSRSKIVIMMRLLLLILLWPLFTLLLWLLFGSGPSLSLM
jgi:hypothetical protein